MLVFLILMLAISDTFPYSDKDVLLKAKPIFPILNEKINKHWNDLKYKHYIAGQIEQESGWNPKAELHTSREWGVGLSQITVTPKYNNFLEAKRKYKELTKWEWSDKFNIEYQLTFLILENKSLYNSVKKLFKDEVNIMAGEFMSYNSGYGAVLQRRALCKTTKGCDYSLFFGGINKVKMNYENRILYGMELWKMRNDYPEKIIFKLSNKYIGLLND